MRPLRQTLTLAHADSSFTCSTENSDILRAERLDPGCDHLPSILLTMGRAVLAAATQCYSQDAIKSALNRIPDEQVRNSGKGVQHRSGE